MNFGPICSLDYEMRSKPPQIVELAKLAIAFKQTGKAFKP